jgi:uracil phosphoribosyltransferase
LIHLLELLEAKGVQGLRVRVITTVAASPGLKQLGERFGDLTLYTGCIDAELDGEGRILPGVGDTEGRLCGLNGSAFVG